MRSCVVLLFASLLTLCEAQGTIVTPVLVLKGRDLLLKLRADPPKGVLYVEWKINKNVTLVRFDHNGKPTSIHNVTGRVQFGENKFSVILKNVQEVDSGVYSVVATKIDELAEYQVTVEGPVSPVELIVDRVHNSSGSCDLHVTCRTHDSDISSTFRCVDRVCIQEGGERSEVTTSGASLQVYLLNNVIICNHNNQVNWTQDLIHAEHLCPKHADPLLHPGWMIATCILTFILILMVLVLIVRLYKDRKKIIGIRHRSESDISTTEEHEPSRSFRSLLQLRAV